MTTYNSKKFASGVAGLLTAVFLACPALAAIPAQTVPTLNSGATNTGLTSIGTSVSGGIKTEKVTTSGNSILNWTNFDVGNKGVIDFAQPSATNVSLNRISGSASEIYGTISSNGRLILVNQNGLNFRDGSHVNVNGLIATTSAVSDPDATGKYTFTPGSNHNATIENRGTISVADGGLVAFVAPNLTNVGTINATYGKVVLASGDTASSVDFTGDGLINLTASDNMHHQLIQNGGTLAAYGGKVILTAAAAKNVVDSQINTTGLIVADTIGTHEGRIVLLADKVEVSGDVLAQGTGSERGGVVEITGRKSVELCDCAHIDTKGQKSTTGSGEITIQTDTLSVHSGARIHTNDNVTFKPYTKSRTIGVAGASGDLQITAAALEAVDGDTDSHGVELESITIGDTTDTGRMKVNAFDWDENVRLLNGTGNIEINGKQELTKNITFLADTVSGDIVLGSSGSVVADDHTTGTPIILAASGGKFTNNNSSSHALYTKNGRWLVYSNNPMADTFGNLASGNYAIWGTSYPTGVGSATGNRYVFAYVPTLTFTSTNDSKTYGSYKNVSADYTVGGLYAGKGAGTAFKADTLASTFSGAPSVTSLGSPVTAPVGDYEITVAKGSLTSLNGYAFAFNSAGVLTVNPARLVVTADDQSKTYGSTFVFDGTEFTVSGTFYNGDTITGATLASAGAAATATVAGSPYKITISDATGTGVSNYNIYYVSGNMTINKAKLTITALDQSKILGTTFIFTGTEFVTSGTYNGDKITGALLASAGAPASATIAGSPYEITISDATGTGIGNYDITYVSGLMTVDTFSLNKLLDRSKAPAKRGPYGTLLSIVNTPGNLSNLAPAAGGSLADLNPKAGGDMNLADLSPQAGGNSGITPLIQCTEATPCDINQ